ncbi:hypothetical protein [Mycolicibacillus trivialis]
MRAVIAVLTAVVMVASGCSKTDGVQAPYGAEAARMGQELTVLGWDMTLSDLRWGADHVLVDVTAHPADGDENRSAPEDLRFGLYGALAHPVEADGIGSCASAVGATSQPLQSQGDLLSGTICLGPMKDRAAVRGIYVYSPADRMPGTTVAYPAAFPVGLAPTGPDDTGLDVSTASVEAWRADGIPIGPPALGDPTAFEGDGHMLLGLVAEAPADRYRQQSQERGGPLMLVVGPWTPGPWANPACDVYGQSALVLPDASLGAARVAVSLCTQGNLTAALLYATVSVIGTHAAVWVDRD